MDSAAHKLSNGEGLASIEASDGENPKQTCSRTPREKGATNQIPTAIPGLQAPVRAFSMLRCSSVRDAGFIAAAKRR